LRRFEVRAWPSDEGLSIFFHDVTARVQAERARARATERLRLLSEAGSRLSATLEVEEILEVLADVYLPDHGTWLAIALRRDEAELMSDRQASAAGVDLRVAYVAAADRGRTDALADALVGAPVEMGRGLAWQHRAAEAMRSVLEAAPGWDGGLDAPEVVALVSRGRTIGAAFVADLTEEPADRRLLGEVTGRAAVALDNATLYGAERRFGRALQELLLPTGLPPLPDIRAAARYPPGPPGATSAGTSSSATPTRTAASWWPSATWSATGSRRPRGWASCAPWSPPTPSRTGGSRLCSTAWRPGASTSSTSRWRPCSSPSTTPPRTGSPTRRPAIRRRWSRRRASRPSSWAGRPGRRWASADRATRARRPSSPPGAVVLYTDGLVENRGESIDAGLERLREALSGLRAPPEAVCDHVLASLGRERGGRDDIALLVLRDGPD
jgi:Stage II sporulation protein E (SpoIIE)